MRAGPLAGFSPEPKAISLPARCCERGAPAAVGLRNAFAGLHFPLD